MLLQQWSKAKVKHSPQGNIYHENFYLYYSLKAIWIISILR